MYVIYIYIYIFFFFFTVPSSLCEICTVAKASPQQAGETSEDIDLDVIGTDGRNV